MSYTNTTPNYELPIYGANDKPTWEGDWNGAMTKIDTAIKAASEGGEGVQEAIDTANAANTAAQSAVTTANAAQTAANNAAKITVTTTDPGEGVPLAANSIIAVVEA